MIYKDRLEAAEILADKLKPYKGKSGIVLAIPAGGIPLGAIVALSLELPLEPLMSKKIGHPENKEFAIGSVDMSGGVYGVAEGFEDSSYIKSESEAIVRSLKSRYKMFMGNRKPASLKDKIVIIIDDGIATGNTLIATISAVRKAHAAKVVVAVPVAPASAVSEIGRLADEFICPLVPEDFGSVGQFYKDFGHVSDEEVISWLEKTRRQA